MFSYRIIITLIDLNVFLWLGKTRFRPVFMVPDSVWKSNELCKFAKFFSLTKLLFFIIVSDSDALPGLMLGGRCVLLTSEVLFCYNLMR